MASTDQVTFDLAHLQLSSMCNHMSIICWAVFYFFVWSCKYPIIVKPADFYKDPMQYYSW